MSFSFSYKPEQEPPFVIFIAHEDERRGSWRPAAMLGFTSALRTSGFLVAIAPDEFHSLLVLLSFLTPDGRLLAFTPLLAQALGTSPAKARSRFERLCEVRWLDQPIVYPVQNASGLDGFAPVPGFIPVVEQPVEAEQTPLIHAVPREAIIAHSRRTYARSRQEVEREIEELMNWRKKPDALAPTSARLPDERRLFDELVAAGLLPEQANELIKHYDALRIRRQLAWLPKRGAKNPAGYLLAAIRDNYAAPRSQNTPPPSGNHEG